MFQHSLSNKTLETLYKNLFCNGFINTKGEEDLYKNENQLCHTTPIPQCCLHACIELICIYYSYHFCIIVFFNLIIHYKCSLLLSILYIAFCLHFSSKLCYTRLCNSGYLTFLRLVFIFKNVCSNLNFKERN